MTIKIIEAMLMSISIVYIMLYIATIPILRHKYKYYKKTYIAIKSKDYVLLDRTSDCITFIPKLNLCAAGFYCEFARR